MRSICKNVGVMTACTLSLVSLDLIGGGRSLSKVGGEYLVKGYLPGDQTFMSIAAGNGGGYLTWNDFQADGNGLGVRGLKLDGNIVSTFDPFTINDSGEGDQRDAKIALMNDADESAFVVFESNGDIVGRVFAEDGTFTTSEIKINDTTDNVQNRPSLCVLENGNVVVAWSSLMQDGSHYGVYARILDADGQFVTPEIQLHVETSYSQKGTHLVALEDGGFYAVWVSELFAGISNSVEPNGRIDFFSGGREFDVVLVGRKFSADGQPLSNETELTASELFSSNPTMVLGSNGDLMLFYSAREKRPSEETKTNGWDIYGQAIDPETGLADGEAFVVNQTTYGDQFVPSACSHGNGFVVVWTSLGHDGDREGIYGNIIQNGQLEAEDILVNTSTQGTQFMPVVASTSEEDCVVVWSGYSNNSHNMEVYAQKFGFRSVAEVPSTLYAFGAGFDSIDVIWPKASSSSVVGYTLLLDEGDEVLESTKTQGSFINLSPGSDHTVQLVYNYADGSKSQPSAPVDVKTWGRDANRDGLPDDWQQVYFGSVINQPIGSDLDSDGDGASNWDELLAGTNPADKTDVLSIFMEQSDEGTWLVWSTVEGGIYQVQKSNTLNEWEDIGDPRFAADNQDAIQISQDADLDIFRIVRLK